MYTLYDSFTLTGQHHIQTWEQQGRSWAAYSNYRQPAAHGLYVPHPVLNLILRGEKRMYDGRRVHHLRAGDVFLIPAGSLICSEIMRPEDDFASINLVLPEHQSEYSDSGPAAATLMLSPASHWQQLAEELLRDFRQPSALPDYESVMCRVLHLLNKEPATVKQALATVPSPSMQQMMVQLHSGLHEVRLLEEVAMMGHVSPATLKRRFRKTYQRSPMDWIWEKRLQMTALLLRSTDLPVQEIAYSTGFEDISHFYRQFRKCFLMTPAQWRRGIN
ncbi:AraC family transcriptional regulator [Chitinophaga sp. HK235]|uniref:helix-turn-helix transcriptional regulator n=1 Tax=Chitinophaga sp. HK235 TaxID=2952571 RepID=UPI001BA7D075|nr:AraC family transcriptional regulator [Chitinophaga sp. HK235]